MFSNAVARKIIWYEKEVDKHKMLYVLIVTSYVIDDITYLGNSNCELLYTFSGYTNDDLIYQWLIKVFDHHTHMKAAGNYCLITHIHMSLINFSIFAMIIIF